MNTSTLKNFVVLLLSILSFQISAFAQCSTPTNLGASSANTGEIVFTWTASTSATKYQIFYRAGGSWSNSSPTTNSYTATGLADGLYEYKVRAYCGGWSGFSAVSTFDLGGGSGSGGTTCTTPTNLVATAATSNTAINFSWDDMGATKYQVFYRISGGSWSNAVPTTNSHLAQNLTSGAYDWKVRAYCSGSWTTFSSTLTFTLGGGSTGTGSNIWTDVTSHIHYDGDVLIGPSNTPIPNGYNLYVAEGLLTEKAKVALISTASWSDYVFEEDYQLNTIKEVNEFIKQNKHLPHVPSAKELKQEGIDVAMMDATLLRQIEELWLHLIKMDKEMKILKEKLSKN